jgi:hypothetical protein
VDERLVDEVVERLMDRADASGAALHVAAHWKEALNQFSLFFEDRLSIQ